MGMGCAKPSCAQDDLGHRDRKPTAVYTRTAAKRFENLWR